MKSLSNEDDSARGPYQQAVVHLQKGRAATEEGLAEAWDQLAPGGRLLLVGGNDLGIKSAVKRLAGELGAPAEIAANRARARVACWRREGSAAPARPVVEPIQVLTADDHFGFEASSWYWHFVDVVWVFLFLFVYIL
mgnify:CR=1 FL=1